MSIVLSAKDSGVAYIVGSSKQAGYSSMTDLCFGVPGPKPFRPYQCAPNTK
jgi:hypothetical protein